ncbi:MAG TPA: hypothetical protein VKY65_05585 [Alphaproteobacteria bacterium]|nr:hypothetical protein [Alphaproteobacteria bacterium]
MTVSRTSRAAIRLLALIVFAGALQTSPQLVRAQGAPIQLLPQRGGAGAAAGAAVPAAPSAAAPPTAAPSAPKGIEVDKLGGIDLDGLGTLGPGQGGFGPEMWRGISRAEAVRLVDALPTAMPSPTLRALARRLLLTTAASPEGPPGDEPSLLTLRAAKLAQMGDIENSRALLDLLPANRSDETAARIRMDGRLIQGDTTNACAEAGDRLRQYHGIYWQKVQIFCQALAHKTEEVDIGVGLLHDEGDDKDTAFFTLVSALEGVKAAKVKSLPEATPLLLAMMRAAEQPLPKDVAHAAAPAILRAVADSPNAAMEERLAAAEQAATLGALAPDALAALYDKAAANAATASAVTGAQAKYDAQSRALLYRAAKLAKSSSERAAIIQAALALARHAGLYAPAVGVNLPLMDLLSPNPSLISFAAEASRAYDFAGRLGAGQAWYALARQGSATSSEAAKATVELWPFTVLTADKSADWEADRFAAWTAAQSGDKAADPKLAGERVARVLGLLSALGHHVPDAAWQPFYATAAGGPDTMPSLALWNGLDAAAKAGRQGQTVLFALIAIGANGPGASDPIAVNHVIAALDKVGLGSEARQLAIEAAIADGV